METPHKEQTGTVNVSERVLEALQNDPRTEDSIIEVSFQNGMVTLSGTVDSEETLHAAKQIAGSEKGVVSVINELHIRT